MNDYDGLNLCAECGDAYTTGTLCHNCARQHAIDNDPMTDYDAIHYDPIYGYDDDDYYDDYEGDGPFEYRADDTIELDTTWKWRIYWVRFKLLHMRNTVIYKLRMKFDRKYRQRFDDIPF